LFAYVVARGLISSPATWAGMTAEDK